MRDRYIAEEGEAAPAILEGQREPLSAWRALVSGVAALAFFAAQIDPCFADPITDAAAQGKVFGQQIVPTANPGSMDSTGNMTMSGVKGTSSSINVQQLFGTSQSMTTVTSNRAQYGDNIKLNTAGQAAMQNLSNSPQTGAGAAYGVQLQSLQLARPTLQNDPMFSQTDQTFGNMSVAAQQFGSCQVQTSYQSTTSTTHVPQYQHCTATNIPPTVNFAATHNYSQNVITVGSGNATIGSCGAGCLDIVIGYPINAYYQLGPVHTGCQVFSIPVQLLVVVPSAITSATVTSVNWDDRAYLNVQGSQVWASPSIPFYDVAANGGNVAGCDLTTEWSATPNVDVTSVFQGSTSVNVTLTVQVGGGGDAWTHIQVGYDPSKVPMTDVWGPTTDMDYATDGFCQITATCQSMPPTDADGCATINGVKVCPDQLAPSPLPGISPLCQLANVQGNCKFYNGQMPCYTDVNGKQQCPNVTAPSTTDCDTLQSNPSCGFVTTQCVAGAVGASGICYLNDETYDCGYGVDVPTVTKSQTSACQGTVRCMGTECVNPTAQQSTDFAKAAGLLQAMQYTQMDTVCTGKDPSTCTVFQGTANSCKKAVGGYVDCCKGAPTDGVSLFTYLKMVSDMQTIGAALYKLDNTSAIGSAYHDIESTLDDAASEMEKPFVEAWNGITGSETDAAVDTADQGLIQGFEQEMEQQIAQWGESVFGPEAMNAVFQVAPEGGGDAGEAFTTTTTETVGEDGTVTTTETSALNDGVISLAPELASALSVIGIVYAVYSITTMIINMVYACEPQELQLQISEKLLECHYLGTYCAQSGLGVCIEQKESYCCFASPLGRILQEQIRPQLGISWGTPQSPSCQALTVANLQATDWSKVDLSEWIAILAQNGQLPNPNTLSAQITGATSTLNYSGTRQDVITRTQSMFNNLSSTTVRTNGASQVQSSINAPGGGSN
jgi:conjugal transfer mating pair stabilization protein TraN